jgi:hypothetical protein
VSTKSDDILRAAREAGPRQRRLPPNQQYLEIIDAPRALSYEIFSPPSLPVACYFAHATHDDYFVNNWKIMTFTPKKRAKTTPFRLVPDDFRQVSLEILNDRARSGPRKQLSGLRFSPLFSPCYVAQPGREQFLSSDWNIIVSCIS